MVQSGSTLTIMPTVLNIGPVIGPTFIHSSYYRMLVSLVEAFIRSLLGRKLSSEYLISLRTYHIPTSNPQV